MRRLRLLPWIATGLLLATTWPLWAEGFGRNAAAVALMKTLQDAASAEEAKDRLLAQSDRGLAAYGLGLLAERAGDRAQAEAHWAEALRGGERYLELVRARAGANRDLAELAVSTYPAHAGALDWLGDAVASDQPARALDLYLQATALDPSNNLVWEKIGALAEQLGDDGLALRAYRRACDLVPIRNGSCLSAGRLAYDAGNWTVVVEYYERGGYPESVEGWVQLIRAAMNLGRVGDAERYLGQAQREYPADYHLLLNPSP